MRHTPNVVLVFVDGLGWGPPDPAANPCRTYGGRLFDLPAAEPGPSPLPHGGFAVPIDATLGVPGLPQSATGQTTLLTGRRAQEALGMHLTGFPNAALRDLLLESSVLKRVAESGRSAAFLNAYRPLFFQLSAERRLRLSATTVANLAAGLPFRTLEDLRAGRAVSQEFTNRELRERGYDVPERRPEEAGRILAREARRLDFALYEYFQTDRAGHAQDRARAEGELARLELFVVGLLSELLPGEAGAAAVADPALVILTSDHGNIEDLSTRGHTRNPVPLMVWGAGAEAVARAVTRLDQVTPALLAALGAPRG